MTGVLGMSYLQACVCFKDLTDLSEDIAGVGEYVGDNMFKEIPLAWPDGYSLRLCGLDSTIYSEADVFRWRVNHRMCDLIVLGTVGRDDDYGIQRLPVLVSSFGVFIHDPYDDLVIGIADNLRTFARIGMIRYEDYLEAARENTGAAAAALARGDARRRRRLCADGAGRADSLYLRMKTSCQRFAKRRLVRDLLVRFGLSRLESFRKAVRIETVISNALLE